MGYRCPVCDAEEADAEHLANHLAITASLGRPEHEAWLEDHAPEWADCSPKELGAIVSEYAETVETPDFDDHDHADHGRPGGLEDGLAHQSRQPGRGSMTAEAEQVLREARKLTEQMADGTDGAADGKGESGTENENA
ncbi:DUF5810 domain-containing protein [Natronococcus jeotgali]|uniref:Uncharacterized protein n=1 Tax=Natronococcus jeotgali DSM 18795 TaxID=1227498 RepID=L9XTG8_9EURY|nr:DUF5810 domain-containing protein [Natronococcus jeotgali]ELY65060.1 hypothetical protein C492_04203 [Natronococcus jeotgali DSM 18795]